MTHDEAKNLVKKLNALFNGQINVEQAKLAVKRLSVFEKKDVNRAIEEHREQFEFVNWPELYKACEPVAAPTPATATANRPAIPDMTFAQVIRQQRPDLTQAKDQEVVLRFWRGDWWRYKSAADRRLQCLTDAMQSGEARARLMEKGYTDEQVTKLHEQVLATHDNNETGYRRKVEGQCRGCLLSAGMGADVVDGWVQTVFSDPDHFRMCLSELRGDIFAGPNAA